MHAIIVWLTKLFPEMTILFAAKLPFQTFQTLTKVFFTHYVNIQKYEQGKICRQFFNMLC